MENKYYSEEIKKDMPERTEYASSVNAFLDASHKKSFYKRNRYMTPQKYTANPEKYRSAFIKMLGFPLTEKPEKPVLLKKEFVARDENVDIFRMQFLFSNGIRFYGIYFRQTEKKPDTPFIISIHGGAGTPELASSINMNSANYNHQTRRCTNRGADVFAPQLLLWSKDNYGSPYNRNDVDAKLRQLGGSATALELYLMQNCITYFLEEENECKSRVGVIGLSYGGMYALHLAAVDTRIKSCFSCSFFNCGFRISFVDWSYFNAANTFSIAETAALICPRAAVCAIGNKDELFDYRFALEEEKRTAPYFEYAGVPQNHKLIIFDGTHELEQTDEGIDFLFEHL